MHCAEVVYEAVLHSTTVNGGRNEVSFREYCSEAWYDVVVRGMRVEARMNRRKGANSEWNGRKKYLACSS